MSKITDSAKHKDCNLRIPGYCQHENNTVCADHLYRSGNGMMGTKSNDIFTVRGCHICHGVIDGRIKTSFTREELAVFKLDGLMETQEQYIFEGLVAVARN